MVILIKIVLIANLHVHRISGPCKACFVTIGFGNIAEYINLGNQTLIRVYKISSDSFKFFPQPSAEWIILLGKVTLENEFLKKAVRNSLKQTQKKESLLPKTAPSSKTLKGGVN